MLDAVEQVIGPNILVWGSSFFIKEPRNPSFVSWHQDSTYWGLEPPDIVTAWVALSESIHENGAMRVIPGSHKLDQAPHRDTFAADNLLSRGQEIMVEVDESKAVELPLQPGEMSLHHVRLIHGSEANPSAKRRIGFAIRYVPTYVRQAVGMRDSATLVRGVDNYRHFEPERRPEFDMAPAAQAHHAEVMARINQVLMRDTAASVGAGPTGRKEIAMSAGTSSRTGGVVGRGRSARSIRRPALCCAALISSLPAARCTGCWAPTAPARAH